MDSLINFFVTKTWKSEYFKSWVLAQARHAATAAGTALVMHGLADKGMAECIVGLVTAAASFYLANLDVKVVDGKIKVALMTEPPTVQTIPVETKELPPVVEKNK